MLFKYSIFTATIFATGLTTVAGSTSPTTSPTTSPSASPSTSPTVSPSASPSTSPTASPSVSPSASPSKSPSTSPTASPSASPSVSPTASPTTSPSAKPSSMPSEVPSSMPSSMPSEVPSLQPSSVPSLQPSSMPSESPSAMPSQEPSAMPSCTPSQAPTPQPSINLFYPNFDADGFDQGCVNDGNQPAYMEASSGTYMHSTLDSCCSSHFSWNYNGCMGQLDDTCNRALWYPDWEGDNTGCIRDGNEPLYMLANPTMYMFNTKADCCSEHYGWSEDCMGSGSSSSGGKYYADWLGDDTCKNDGSAPSYMVSNPSMWLHDTLADCCAKNYNWKLDECMGTSETASSGLFYPDWSGSNEGCLNDGSEPAYMLANPTMWMFDTLAACCERHYTYNLSACTGEAASSGTAKFYMDWGNNKCVQDCEGAAPCGGLAESWDQKYDTQDECCAEKMSWDTKSCKA